MKREQVIKAVNEMFHDRSVPVGAGGRSMSNTDEIRRKLSAGINTGQWCRESLTVLYGQVWDTEELRRDFEVIGFAAPLVVVVSRDGIKGSLMFVNKPRLYFNFEPHHGLA